eukprot:403340850
MFGIKLAILNTRLDANIISNKANGRVVDIEKITCTLNSAGNPLWIYDVRSINSNKISFLRIKQLVKDSSIIDVIYSTCNIKIAGVQVENNNLNTGQFISIGTSASEYYKLSLEDFIFTSNTILNNPLIELNLYSQEISMKNITFNNNQGQLIKFKPNSISSVKPYNQIVTITDIKFVNNINDEFSLISLEKQTQVTLTGSISGNTILSNTTLFLREAFQMLTHRVQLHVPTVLLIRTTELNQSYPKQRMMECYRLQTLKLHLIMH